MAEIIEDIFKEYKLSKSPLSNYGMDRNDSEKIYAPRVCASCKKCEKPDASKYKVCFRCKVLRIPKTHSMYKHYCCKKCQEDDWRSHLVEHETFEALLIEDKSFKGTSKDDYEGKSILLYVRFPKNAAITEDKVREILVETVSDANLLSLAEVDDHWEFKLKSGRHVTRALVDGFDYTYKERTYHTFPRPHPSTMENLTVPKPKPLQASVFAHQDDRTIPEFKDLNDHGANCVQIEYKHDGIEKEEVIEALHSKVGKGNVLNLQEVELDRWVVKFKEPAHVDLVKEGLEYNSKGVTYIAYPTLLKTSSAEP